MPLSIRAKGVSLSTSTNWAFNFLVGEITPELQEVITWRLYPMHGFFCVCSFILGKLNVIWGISTHRNPSAVYFCKCSLSSLFPSRTYPSIVYPETKGVPLEEMDLVFGEGETYRIHYQVLVSDEVWLQTNVKKEKRMNLMMRKTILSTTPRLCSHLPPQMVGDESDVLGKAGLASSSAQLHVLRTKVALEKHSRGVSEGLRELLYREILYYPS